MNRQKMAEVIWSLLTKARTSQKSKQTELPKETKVLEKTKLEPELYEYEKPKKEIKTHIKKEPKMTNKTQNKTEVQTQNKTEVQTENQTQNKTKTQDSFDFSNNHFEFLKVVMTNAPKRYNLFKEDSFYSWHQDLAKQNPKAPLTVVMMKEKVSKLQKAWQARIRPKEPLYINALPKALGKYTLIQIHHYLPKTETLDILEPKLRALKGNYCLQRTTYGFQMLTDDTLHADSSKHFANQLALFQNFKTVYFKTFNINSKKQLILYHAPEYRDVIMHFHELTFKVNYCELFAVFENPIPVEEASKKKSEAESESESS